MERLVPAPPDHPKPHPDFVQIAFAGQADRRAGADWVDVDGYVLHGWLAAPAEARILPLGPVSLPFLAAVGG